MVRTKQTERKQFDPGMQRAEFPARPSESEDLSGSSDQAEDAKPREDTEPRANTEVSEAGPSETGSAARPGQQPCTQIVLPRHTSVEGMDSSFINYFRKHGMTPYLMQSLMTKRGWTLQMVNRVIKNCNSALKTDVAPIQSLRYSDEVDTDEELGPLPRTKDNSSAAATTVTSKTLYTAEETPAQTALQARVETVTKKGRGRGVSVSVAQKEPRNLQRG